MDSPRHVFFVAGYSRSKPKLGKQDCMDGIRSSHTRKRPSPMRLLLACCVCVLSLLEYVNRSRCNLASLQYAEHVLR